MRWLKSVLGLAVGMGLVGISGAQAAKPQSPAQEMKVKESVVAPSPEWEKIKSLAGEWEGTAGTLKSIVTYKVTGAGSAVMMITPSEKPGDEMVTMFHPDGKNIMVTHYCSAKNQPRMRLVPSGSPNELRFKFLDVTNLTSPDQGYMQELALLLDGPNHHVQEWVFSQDGKTMTEKFDMRRKK